MRPIGCRVPSPSRENLREILIPYSIFKLGGASNASSSTPVYLSSTARTRSADGAELHAGDAASSASEAEVDQVRRVADHGREAARREDVAAEAVEREPIAINIVFGHSICDSKV